MKSGEDAQWIHLGSLVVLMVLATVVWWLLRDIGPDAGGSDVNAEPLVSQVYGEKQTVASTGTATQAVRSFELRNGSSLMARDGGMEANLLDHLADSPLETWSEPVIEWQGGVFEAGTTDLKRQAVERVKNLAKILKAYPSLELRIEAYSNHTSNALDNLRLSHQQALTLRDALLRFNIALYRIKAEGLGGMEPSRPNAVHLRILRK